MDRLLLIVYPLTQSSSLKCLHRVSKVIARLQPCYSWLEDPGNQAKSFVAPMSMLTLECMDLRIVVKYNWALMAISLRRISKCIATHNHLALKAVDPM